MTHVVISQYWELSTSVLLQIISRLLNSGLQKTAQGSMTEKVKNRLEQLDDFEEVTVLEIVSGGSKIFCGQQSICRATNTPGLDFE